MKLQVKELRRIIREVLEEERDPGLANPGVSDAWKGEVKATDKRSAKLAAIHLHKLHHLFALSGLPVWGGYVQVLKAMNRFRGRDEMEGIETKSGESREDEDTDD